jgi:hypothetical protein
MSVPAIIEEIQVIFFTFENKLRNLACGDILPPDLLFDPKTNKLLANPYDTLKTTVISSLTNDCTCTTDSCISPLFSIRCLLFGAPLLKAINTTSAVTKLFKYVLVQCNSDQQR